MPTPAANPGKGGKMNIRDLRISSRMTQKQFAEYFKIPLRTIENWETSKRNPPEYVIELIKYKLEKEDLLMKLVELNEGTRKELTQGTLQEIVDYLRNNPDLYEWQLENDPDAEMPDFTEIKTLRDMEYELDKINLSWWSLVIEK